MAGSNSHNPTHNLGTNFTILRKNKHTNQQEKTTKRSNNCLNTLPHNSGDKNSYHHNQPMKRKETRRPARLQPTFYTAANMKARLDSMQTKILQLYAPLLETLFLTTTKQH